MNRKKKHGMVANKIWIWDTRATLNGRKTDADDEKGKPWMEKGR